MEAPGRGGDVASTDLKDVKVDGNNVSFKVTRNMGGNDVTTEYKGTIDGDTITVKLPCRPIAAVAAQSPRSAR